MVRPVSADLLRSTTTAKFNSKEIVQELDEAENSAVFGDSRCDIQQ